MKIKKIIAIISALTMTVCICGCKENPSDEVSSATLQNAIIEPRQEYTSSDAEIDAQKQTTVNLSKTITNSEYCDMNYTISIPDWEYESDYIIPQTKYDSYTRIYGSKDEKLKFFITEYTAPYKYIGEKNKDFGSTDYAEALGLVALPTNTVIGYLDYYNNYNIISKQPDYIDGEKKYYEFCLQYPNANDDFYYTKGYILIGIKHPIVVYFFDGTDGTIYDEEMMSKSLEIIKSVHITE